MSNNNLKIAYTHNKPKPIVLQGFIKYEKRPNEKGEMINTMVGYYEPRQNETMFYALTEAHKRYTAARQRAA